MGSAHKTSEVHRLPLAGKSPLSDLVFLSLILEMPKNISQPSSPPLTVIPKRIFLSIAVYM